MLQYHCIKVLIPKEIIFMYTWREIYRFLELPVSFGFLLNYVYDLPKKWMQIER